MLYGLKKILPSLSPYLGLFPLKKLLYSGDYELRIELEDWKKDRRYAKYSIFSIDFKDDYRLRVLGYTGNAGTV